MARLWFAVLLTAVSAVGASCSGLGIGEEPLPRAASDAIGLALDDTIFTLSARTRNFNGQGLFPRWTEVKAGRLYDGGDRVADPAARTMRIRIGTLKAVFGLRSDLTLGVTLPWVEKRLDAGDGGVLLPPQLRPAAGAWGGILGAAFTRLWDGGRWLVKADLLLRAFAAAAGHRFGRPSAGTSAASTGRGRCATRGGTRPPSTSCSN